MAILRDNKRNMFRIETCKYCANYKGQPKPILPEDMWSANKMTDGSYKCLTCQTEELQTKILKIKYNTAPPTNLYILAQDGQLYYYHLMVITVDW